MEKRQNIYFQNTIEKRKTKARQNPQLPKPLRFPLLSITLLRVNNSIFSVLNDFDEME